jgi:hypothetical protein
MKKIIKHSLALMVATIMLITFSAARTMAQTGSNLSVSYQTFYDDLSPYGTWIDYPAYGHVWHPAIAGEFRPYLTNGYWDYSAEGWLWQSNYNWGWAPFHYGRWVYDDLYGWLWIPGYEWSPAWVTWGDVDNYYAWAPLMPEVNVGIAFNLWRPSAFYWNICSRDHIYDRDIFNRVEKRELVGNYVNRINVINNFNSTRIHNQYYSKGPAIEDVEKYTNRKIQPASIKEVSSSSMMKHQGNEIQVYRPVVTHPQPRLFRRLENNNANPVRNNEDRINNGANEQRQNVERLPVHKAPESTFRREGGIGNNRNEGRRGRGN